MLNSKKAYKIKDMHCPSCATVIQMELEDAGYICKCSYATETLEIDGPHDHKKIMDIVKKAGYTLEI